MKKIIKKLLQKYGYNILPYHPEDLGKHPYRDIEKLLKLKVLNVSVKFS